MQGQQLKGKGGGACCGVGGGGGGGDYQAKSEGFLKGSYSSAQLNQ